MYDTIHIEKNLEIAGIKLQTSIGEINIYTWYVLEQNLSKDDLNEFINSSNNNKAWHIMKTQIIMEKFSMNF